MEGPCSVERRLLTGNLKWLHWLVVIRHLILPVGLLTSFKVPSRIGGILRPRRGLSSKALAFPVALAALAALVAFPKRHVSLSLVGLPWTIAKIKILGWGGAGVPSIQWPVADRPTAAPLSPQWPVTSDHHCPPPAAHHPQHPPVPRDVALHHRLVFNSTAPLPARSVLLLIPAYTTITKKIHSFAAAAAASLTFAFCNHPLRKSSLTPVIRLFLFLSCDRRCVLLCRRENSRSRRTLPIPPILQAQLLTGTTPHTSFLAP